MKLTDEQVIEYMYQNGHFSLPVADYITKKLKENEQLRQEVEIQTINAKTYLQEAEQLRKQVARMREALEAILREFDDFGNRRDGLRAFEALRMAKTSLSDTPTEYHNPADVEEIERLKEQVDTLSATVNMLAPTEIGKECRHIEALRKARETLEFYASKRKYITGLEPGDVYDSVKMDFGEKAREALAAIGKAIEED